MRQSVESLSCRFCRRATSMRLLGAAMAIEAWPHYRPPLHLKTCSSAWLPQLAVAADKDIGIWIDRVTRNAGMSVACDRKLVEFTRFTYVGSPSMTADWKAARSSEWNAAHCNNLLWKEAIDNGWAVVLNIATADGGRATFKAQCRWSWISRIGSLQSGGPLSLNQIPVDGRRLHRKAGRSADLLWYAAPALRRPCRPGTKRSRCSRVRA